MGLLSRLHNRGLHARSRDPLDDFWYSPLAGYIGHAGVRVTPELAMTLSAIWAATTIYAKTIGSLPCILYRALDRGKERARDHHLYDRLRWQPNQWQTAMEFWEMVVGHWFLRGIHFSQIVEGSRSFAEQLIPRNPDRMTQKMRPDNTLQFEYRLPNGDTKTFFQDEMFVVRGFSSDGVHALSLIQYGAQAFGAHVAAETFAAKFFAQGAAPALAVVHPGQLGEAGLKNLRDSVTSYASGLANAHGVLALEEDVKLTVLGIKPADAQLVAVREFGVEDVARWADLPVHRLRANRQGTSSYASVEMFEIEMIVHSFRPVAVRIEQAIHRDLILEHERESLFVEYLFDALARGDMTARGEFYSKMWDRGAFSVNDILELENRNPVEGGDRRFVPANMMPLDRVDEAINNRRTGPVDRRAALIAHEVAQALVRKEVAAVTGAAKRHAASPDAWNAALVEFYEDFAHDICVRLKVSPGEAREYAARHGLALREQGVVAAKHWEATAPAELVCLALDARPSAA
ncbi:MAG TPA: phage portal protein [Vicinamibacterales bacterium]|nr:phage portal protein [Vicinamibacterales bacterium]